MKHASDHKAAQSIFAMMLIGERRQCRNLSHCSFTTADRPKCGDRRVAGVDPRGLTKQATGTQLLLLLLLLLQPGFRIKTKLSRANRRSKDSIVEFCV